MKDLDVSIDADTDTHSEAPRDTERDKDGEFSWSGVQDGVYSIAVASSDHYTVTPKSDRVNVYHDEFEDDDDEDTDYVGTADTDHADFSATFTYYNFALLHGDGEFSGRVFEARGEPGGIAVELRHEPRRWRPSQHGDRPLGRGYVGFEGHYGDTDAHG